MRPLPRTETLIESFTCVRHLFLSPIFEQEIYDKTSMSLNTKFVARSNELGFQFFENKKQKTLGCLRIPNEVFRCCFILVEGTVSYCYEIVQFFTCLKLNLVKFLPLHIKGIIETPKLWT